MAFRIKSQRPIPVKAKPVQEAGYFEFIKTLPCVITGMSPVDPAHLSSASRKYGHAGRGKGQRAHSRWLLPLCRLEHDQQHRFKGGEMKYWKARGVNPHVLALALYGAWLELGHNAEQACRDIIEQHRPG